jgi:hypothetical protein
VPLAARSALADMRVCGRRPEQKDIDAPNGRFGETFQSMTHVGLAFSLIFISDLQKTT